MYLKANKRTVLLFILGVEFLRYGYIFIKDEKLPVRPQRVPPVPETKLPLHFDPFWLLCQENIGQILT